MQQKCEYCGAYINDTDAMCPHCGAVNDNVMRSADGIPKTIGELKAYAVQNHLPLEQMRFFIGEDYRGARAFGIYEENGIYTVYKNKADGTRVIRYHGTDEAYAVNELYQKMHAEIMMRKQQHTQSRTVQPSSRRKGTRLGLIMMIIWVVIVAVILLLSAFQPHRGYYHYNGTPYYYQSGDWYAYDDDGGWYSTDPDDTLRNNAGDYYDGDGYSSDDSYSDFRDSDYYREDSNNDDGWDNNDDWDGGSWDSGGTDWDSDW